MLSVPLGKRPLFDKLWKFLRHPKGTIEKGVLTQEGRREAEQGRGQCFPGWQACDSQLSDTVRKYLRSNLQGIQVCSAHGFRGLSPWSGDLQEARGRGGWSLQGSRWWKRVGSLGPDIPWRTHPTIAFLPAPFLISQGSNSSQYCLPEKQTFNI